MMSAQLNGKRVAFLVTDGFEQVELTSPREALENSGAVVDILSEALAG
jgi:protease I